VQKELLSLFGKSILESTDIKSTTEKLISQYKVHEDEAVNNGEKNKQNNKQKK